MAKVALFGDSYIKRLSSYCKGFLGIPGDCRFYGVGGMRADSPNNEPLRQLIRFQPDTVCICLGGNDISVDSSPKKTYEDIVGVVDCLRNSGIEMVYICEILTRGQFRKSPGLNKKTFDKKRKLINKKLRKTYKEFFVTFSDIHYPDHYDTDGVHINSTISIRDGRPAASGMKKFQCRLARILCRH